MAIAAGFVERDAHHPEFILTAREFGYKFQIAGGGPE